MAVTQFTCPGCRSTLRSPKPLAAGTKIKCPKCTTVFSLSDNGRSAPEEELARAAARTSRPPQQEEEFAEYDRGYDEEDDYRADDDDRPRKKKKKSKRGNNNNLVLIGSISGLAVLLAAGLLSAFVWPGWLKSGGSDDPLVYLPANSTVVVAIEAEDLIDQLGMGPMISQLFAQDPNGGKRVKDLKDETGMEFKEFFHQVTVAWTAPIQGLIAGMMSGTGKYVAVCKSKAAYDSKKILKVFGIDRPPERIKGQTCYKSEGPSAATMFMPAKRLMVFTNFAGKELEDLIGASGSKPPDMLAAIDTVRKGQIWAAVAFDDAARQNLQKELPSGAAGQDMPILKAAFPQAKGAGAWISIEGNQVQFNGGLICADSNTATQVAGEMQKSWDKQTKGVTASLQMTMLLAFLPKGPMQDIVKELMNNTKFAGQDALALASTRTTLQNVKSVIQEAPKLAMGGFGGVGGAPPGKMPGPGIRPNPGFPQPARPAPTSPGGRRPRGR
jgi:hypothetical protein